MTYWPPFMENLVNLCLQKPIKSTLEMVNSSNWPLTQITVPDWRMNFATVNVKKVKMGLR